MMYGKNTQYKTVAFPQDTQDKEGDVRYFLNEVKRKELPSKYLHISDNENLIKKKMLNKAGIDINQYLMKKNNLNPYDDIHINAMLSRISLSTIANDTASFFRTFTENNETYTLFMTTDDLKAYENSDQHIKSYSDLKELNGKYQTLFAKELSRKDVKNHLDTCIGWKTYNLQKEVLHAGYWRDCGIVQEPCLSINATEEDILREYGRHKSSQMKCETKTVEEWGKTDKITCRNYQREAIAALSHKSVGEAHEASITNDLIKEIQQIYTNGKTNLQLPKQPGLQTNTKQIDRGEDKEIN